MPPLIPRPRWRLPWQRPLRVVIDARMADGVSGGVQQWIIGIANALSKLDGASEEYRFLVNEGQADWLLPFLTGQCEVLPPPNPAPPRTRKPRGEGRGRRPARSLAPARIVRRLRRRLERLRPPRPEPSWLSTLDERIRLAGADVIHFPRQSAFLTAVPSIYQPWDLQHLHLPEFFTPEDRQSRESTYRTFAAQAELIVVASRWIKEDICAQYGIAPERVAIVNPPPVTAAYTLPTPGEKAAIVDRLQLPARYAFYPAQPWSHKNHERLLEALRQLRNRGLEVPLVCTGYRNARYPEVMRRAAELDVEGQVTFLGYLSPAEVQVVYGDAALLVFPSLYEGWGLPILEAFAADLPVVCSNVTSLPALVGDAALVFDPSDPNAIAAAVERVWLDDDLRATLVERGRLRLADFDWERTAMTLRAHYRRLAGRRLGPDDRRLLAAPAPV